MNVYWWINRWIWTNELMDEYKLMSEQMNVYWWMNIWILTDEWIDEYKLINK